jgi:hypothetical protein
MKRRTGVTKPVAGDFMTLEEVRLMRDRWLRELEGQILNYRESIAQAERVAATPDELQADWGREADSIERIYQAVRQLREALLTDVKLTYSLAGIPLEELSKVKLPQVRFGEPSVDLRAIRTSLCSIGVESGKREAVAVDVVHQLQTHVTEQLKIALVKVRGIPGERDEDHNSRWAFELLALANLYAHMPMAATEQTGDFASEMWRAFDDRLRKRLRDTTPPMTWGEILYHFLAYLDANRGLSDVDAQRHQIDAYLLPPAQFYCLDCDRPFTLDSRHTGRFICPRCRAKERKRRERKRKRQGTPR